MFMFFRSAPSYWQFSYLWASTWNTSVSVCTLRSGWYLAKSTVRDLINMDLSDDVLENILRANSLSQLEHFKCAQSSQLSAKVCRVLFSFPLSLSVPRASPCWLSIAPDWPPAWTWTTGPEWAAKSCRHSVGSSDSTTLSWRCQRRTLGSWSRSTVTWYLSVLTDNNIYLLLTLNYQIFMYNSLRLRSSRHCSEALCPRVSPLRRCRAAEHSSDRTPCNSHC